MTFEEGTQAFTLGLWAASAIAGIVIAIVKERSAMRRYGRGSW